MRKIILGLVILLLAITNSQAAWDKTLPATGTTLANSNPELLANFSAIDDVIGTMLGEGDAITSTAVELNLLDGVTSTTDELNILDGVTSTYAELNALDGITSTVTELNYTDGVTSAIQTQLDAGIRMPSGAIFFMLTGSCPAGTTDVTSTYSDRFLKVNSTQGTTAGPTLTGTVDSHTLTEAEMPAHIHTYHKGVSVSESDGLSSAYKTYTSANTGSTGGSGGHTHTVSSATTLEPKSFTCKMCQVN